MTAPELARPSADVPEAPPVGRRPHHRARRRVARVAVVLVALLAVSAGTGAVLTLQEEAAQHYGQLVTLPGGGSVNTSVSGTGDETFVIMPGYGSVSPVLEFAPLVDDLDDHATVVVVEPFGYGWSDRRAGTDRTAANITTELHQTLTALGVHRPYTLVAHSVGALYALDYVDRFPGEVRGVVTIDGQVPLDGPVPDEGRSSRWTRLWSTTGVLRWVSAFVPTLLVQAPEDTYPEPVRRTMRTLALRNDSGPALVEENHREAQNVESARRLAYPAALPVLAFVAQDNMDALAEWYPAHQRQLARLDRSEIVVIDDVHQLHHHHAHEIADATRAFLDAPA